MFFIVSSQYQSPGLIPIPATYFVECFCSTRTPPGRSGIKEVSGLSIPVISNRFKAKCLMKLKVFISLVPATESILVPEWVVLKPFYWYINLTGLVLKHAKNLAVHNVLMEVPSDINMVLNQH